MRRKKGRKKSFTHVKTEKNDDKSYENDDSSLAFSVGDEVLACWQDGLYYLAVIKTISTEKSKCQVSYEDDSIYWVLFKHIRTVAKSIEGYVSCSVCDKMDSSPQNDIIVCDSCFHGYHQACHAPVINVQTIESTKEWLCRICVFSKAAKAGGALKDGSDADAMRALKGVLPYELNVLQWDAYHKSNTDEIFCYCGGPGLWYYKMLQCYHCHQWFHEACLQCLDFPLLLGDRFYYFVCAVCNDGQEYLKRIQLKWSDIAALLLYNLSLKYDKKGLKIVDIQRFLKESWDVLQCGNLQGTPEEERMQKVIEVFKKQKHRFRSICVNGIVTWSLLNRTSPCPTKAVLLHEAKAKSDCEMKSRFLDCNGNYLQASNTQENSTTSNEVNIQNEASTSDALTSYQAPLFPSLSMFKYLFPNCGARAHADESPDVTSPSDRYRSDSERYPTPGDKRPLSSESAGAAVNEPIEKRFVTYVERLTDGVTSYSGTNGRLACGEDCSLLGRRLARNGRIEYLVQWSGVTPDSF